MTATNEDTRQVVKLPMACACGDERRDEMMERRAKVSKKLNLGPQHEVNYISQLIFSLGHEFKDYYGVEHVDVDQWMGMSVGSKDKRITLSCDMFEDGLTAVWLYLVEEGELAPDDE